MFILKSILIGYLNKTKRMLSLVDVYVICMLKKKKQNFKPFTEAFASEKVGTHAMEIYD